MVQKSILKSVCGLFALFFVLWATPGKAQKPSDLIEETDTGRINWSQFTVQAAGVGAVTEKPDDSTPQITLQKAKQTARQNIFKTLRHLRVDHRRSVSHLLEKNPRVEEEIHKILQNARVMTQEYLSDGTAKVLMEMHLRGAFSQLVLPPELKQIESVKPVVPQENTPPPFTGLIVDAEGIPMKPSLVPKIVDESRKAVFGPAFASRESAVQQGMCRYVVDLGSARQAPRAGSRPLVVKGLKIQNGDATTIVISTADAAKLKSASAHLQLLRKCFVVIATGPVMQ